MLSSKILKPMGYACCFLFILCFVAIIYYILSDEDNVCKIKRPDYNILALELLPVSCLKKNRCFKLQDSSNIWGIHGLWPSSHTMEVSFCCKNRYSKCCDNPELNLESLVPIMTQLKDHWPSMEGSNARFWNHEWEKHGTCSLSSPQISDQLGYFNKSLELFNQLSIQDVLARSNIKPTRDPRNTVKLQDVRKAIEAKVGAQVYILCQQHVQNRFFGSQRAYLESSLLSGIRVCLNSSFKPINCRSSVRGCKPLIIYPNFGFSY